MKIRLLLYLLLALQTPVTAQVFEVNAQYNSSDSCYVLDYDQGDGICSIGDCTEPYDTRCGFEYCGICPLRAAVMEANAYPGQDEIHFSISSDSTPGTGVTGPVIIDGTTSPTGNFTITEGGIGFFADGNIIKGIIAHEVGNYGSTGIILNSSSNHVSQCETKVTIQSNGANNIIQDNNLTDILIGYGNNNSIINNDVSGSIDLTDDSHNNQIISNVAARIHVVGDQNSIENNYVGTDRSASVLLGGTGMMIGGNSNTVEGNIIAGSIYDGLRIYCGQSIDGWAGGINNIIRGNAIGTNFSGAMNLGNAGHGIYIGDVPHYTRTNGDCASFNTIGDGNIIANNGGDGVAVNYYSLSNSIQNNSIKNNTGIGIKLFDENSLYTGHYGNNGQPAPEITGAFYSIVHDTVDVSGILNSAPNTSYVLEIFSNTECDPTGYGEGESMLGSTIIVTDASGSANFNLTFPFPDKSLFITATATNPDANTSRFSNCLTPNQTPVINEIELTQVTQVLQPSPKIPIVAGKPGMLRIYFEEPTELKTYKVEITGLATGVKENYMLDSGCTPEAMRRGDVDVSCQSVDFSVSDIPVGASQITVLIYENNIVVDQQQVNINAISTRPIYLVPISICDQPGKCGDIKELIRNDTMLQSLVPTNNVNWAFPPCFNLYNLSSTKEPWMTDNDWWSITLNRLALHWREADKNCGSLQDYYFIGAVRNNDVFPSESSPPVGGVAGTGSNIAMVRTSGIYLGEQARDNILAHEVFHMLGNSHPNINVDVNVNASPPACFLKPNDVPLIDGDASIKEIGYNMYNNQIILPKNQDGSAIVTYELMNYCLPHWVSPDTYTTALSRLTAADKSHVITPPGSGILISGLITDTGITLDPILNLEQQSLSIPDNSVPGYVILLMDSMGVPLYSHGFLPVTTDGSGFGLEETKQISFTEFLPNIPGTALIFIGAPDNISTFVVISGQAPTVSMDFPVGGETLVGVQQLQWQVSDPDSTQHYYRIEYTVDDGLNWAPIVSLQTTNTLTFDFDDLPGSVTSSRIKVIATDGVNTGSVVSNAFTVPDKLPNIIINHPEPYASYNPGDLVWLQAVAWDSEDGFSVGGEISWVSNIDGSLGAGSSLPINSLSVNTHQIMASFNDDDGNMVNTTITVIIAQNVDTDGDGLSDQYELSTGTDPNLVDTDGDGLADGTDGVVPVGVIPNAVDINNDGYIDGEQSIGTNPLQSDSDGDLIDDGVEVSLGSDPLDSLSWPAIADGDLAPLGNPNGVLNAGDVVIALRIVSGLLMPSTLELAHGDMNSDGVIDISDLIVIMRNTLTNINQ